MNFDKLIDYLGTDKKEFYFQFNSHPDYPSALAFSDTLNFLGIKNDAYELEKGYWNELPNEFISITRGKFTLVKKTEEKIILYSDDLQSISNQALLENSENFVMLIEKNEKSNRTDSFNYQNLLYIAAGIVILQSLLNLKWYDLVYNILSLTGIYISLEIFKQKYGNESSVMNRICGGNTAVGSAEGCLKIISSDTTKLLGLKLSDYSLIYFTTTALLGLLLPEVGLLLKIFAMCSIAVIGYSLYIQIVVEKTFCKICLIIISLLVFQLVICSLFFNSILSSKYILAALIIILLTFSAVHYINELLYESKELSRSNTNNLKFKRNYTLFKKQLLENGLIKFKNPQSPFFIGDQNTPIHISLISNPYCGFCKEGHRMVEKLLKMFPGKISVQIRFNYLPEQASEEYTQLITFFKNVYDKHGSEKFLNAVDIWYEDHDYQKLLKKIPMVIEPTGLESIISNTHENYEHQLNFTPLFLVNGRQYPEMYSREDIFYFIEELLEDDEIMQ